MVISNRPFNHVLYNVSIRGHVVDRVNVSKFLGVFIDERLNFKFHVNSLRKKISRSVGILKRVSYFVPANILKNLYYSFLYPHFVYGVVVWGGTGSCNTRKMSSLHSRALLTVFGSSDTDTLLRNGILNFDSILQFFILIKFFTLRDNHLNNNLLCSLNQVTPIHNHSTRFSNSSNYNIPQFRISKAQNSFIYKAIKFWNSLPVPLQNLPNNFSFKKGLKNHLLSCQG